MTFEQKFKALRPKFKKADTKTFDRDFAIQFTMTDEDCGGTFYVSYIGGKLAVEPFDYKDNTATVTASADSIAEITAGKVGTQVINGDASIVGILANSYTTKTTAKKPAAKKTTTKKATAKAADKKEETAKKTTVTKKATAKKEEAPKTTAVAAPATTTVAKVEEKPAAKKTCAKKACAKKSTDKATK